MNVTEPVEPVPPAPAAARTDEPATSELGTPPAEESATLRAPAELEAANAAAGGAPPAPATGWAKLRAALGTGPSRGQLLSGLLCGALGFAAVTQVRLSQEDLLAQADRSDLVQILDGLTQRGQALQDEIAELQQSRRELASSADQGQTALEQARRRAYELGVLAGTQEATGPGIVLRIDDPDGQIGSSVLLGAVQELRDAGAEVIEIEGGGGAQVRVVASTWFADGGDGVEVDGTVLPAPWTITAIGDPDTLATAMRFPGGVTATVEDRGGTADVRTEEEVEIDALRPASQPEYASPAAEPAQD